MGSSSKDLKGKKKFAYRLAFSKFTENCIFDVLSTKKWRCCNDTFAFIKDLHKHISTKHASNIQHDASNIISNGCDDRKWQKLYGCANTCTPEKAIDLPISFEFDHVYEWLPSNESLENHFNKSSAHEGSVLLFYTYRKIENKEHVKNWQIELCSRLKFTGKIRIAGEGLNATVAGDSVLTEIYIKSVMSHPLFGHMSYDDFKKSKGYSDVFPNGLKVGIFEECVPMGIRPDKCSNADSAKHVSPDEFHDKIESHINGDKNLLFVDCRNFYESKVGKFTGAVTPDIRKFSYWPKYVDSNEDLFKDKSVYMYCTGGIRCERGSSYLQQKGICKNIYQLEGGIHRYIEKFPEGHFRGKLFVFDNRYTIKSNDDVISQCAYCGVPWDSYILCSSEGCCQLVLSCDNCREKGSTACCIYCQEQSRAIGKVRELCNCTEKREQIPIENKT